jgi:hypothetical protein
MEQEVYHHTEILSSVLHIFGKSLVSKKLSAIAEPVFFNLEQLE